MMVHEREIQRFTAEEMKNMEQWEQVVLGKFLDARIKSRKHNKAKRRQKWMRFAYDLLRLIGWVLTIYAFGKTYFGLFQEPYM